ncbi:MAG: hypothetical protein K9N06_09850 [Candidatus Cloacimonetes bacterium]|nr:hypothetical protein [Candidatus Cloacimonadota bacterium]
MSGTIRVMFIMALLVYAITVYGVSYDLNSYQTPAHIERNLDLSFKGSGNQTKRDSTLDKSHTTDLNVTFSEERYTRRCYLLWESSLAGASDWRRHNYDENPEEYYDNFHLEPAFSFSGEFVPYILGNWFAHSRFAGDWRGYFSNNESLLNDTSYDSETDKNTYILNAELGSGYGRVENVSKARDAIYFLDELESEGLLCRVVEIEEVTRLADLLVSLDQLHLFDSRLQQKEETRRIFALLVEAGLLKEHDMEAILVIQDINRYTGMYDRYSGWEVYPLAYLDYYKFDSDSESKYDYTDGSSLDRKVYTDRTEKDQTTGSAVRFRYARNLGKNWQLDFNSELGFCYKDYRYDYSKEEIILRDVTSDVMEYDLEGKRMEMYLAFNWYPDTRTRLRTGLDYIYVKDEGDGLEADEDERIEYDINYEYQYIYVYSSCSYYISPRFNATLSVSLSNQMNRGGYSEQSAASYKRDTFKFGYHLGFSYKIF